MGAGPAVGARSIGEMDRFHQYALLGMLASGYCALAGSGALDPPTLALTGAALALRVLIVAGRIRLPRPERLATAASIGYIGFYPLDYLYFSGNFLDATVHLVCFLAAVQVLTAHSERSYFFVKVIALLEMLAASLLPSSAIFFLFVALFLCFGIATLASSEIRHSMARCERVAQGGRRGLARRLSFLSLFVLAGILAAAAGLFIVLPRTARAAFQHLAPERFHLPGFGDEVRLGEIGSILQSSAPAMHVRFDEGVKPPPLKWRGAALADFDGRRWFNARDQVDSMNARNGPLVLATNRQLWRKGTRVGFEVQLNAAASGAVFTAGRPEFLWIPVPEILRGESGALRVPEIFAGPLRYRMQSFIEDRSAEPNPELAAAQRANSSRYQHVPPLDSRVAGLARAVTAGLDSDSARARAIEQYLSRTYPYTLELPRERVADPVAHFLFVRRKGHCEYFSSSMALMLRTLNIPARVVTGFQSGIYNPISGWYLIRASDAHSWVEAWLPDRGWTDFDPTPAAPGAGRIGLWTSLQLYADAVDVFWQNWVLSYDFERQLILADRMGRSGRTFSLDWASRMEAWKADFAAAWKWTKPLLPWLLPAMAALAALILLWPRLRGWWRRRARVKKVKQGEGEASDATLLYARMLELLRARGVEKPSWLTAAEFARGVPAWARGVVEEFTAAYLELRFGRRRQAAPRMLLLLEQLEKQDSRRAG